MIYHFDRCMFRHLNYYECARIVLTQNLIGRELGRMALMVAINYF